MKNYELEENKARITYTVEEPSTKADPFFLQNLMYDLPFELDSIDELTIDITIPKDISTYIIDDIHFDISVNNSINLTLHENSVVTYQFFVANHQLCDLCDKKEFFDCQTLPEQFEKTVKIVLEEENAHAYIKCHYLGDGKSKFTLHTTQHHVASNTTSKLMVKSVLDGAAKFVTDNAIVVEKNLTKVAAEQASKNLMLAPSAHVIAIPKLRVHSQNVACKHGATVTKIDSDQLFYLESRGIEKADAERMLIEAFLR